MSRGYHLWTETITDNLRSFVYQTWHTIEKNGPANFEWCSESNSFHLTGLSTELTFLQLWKLYVHICKNNVNFHNYCQTLKSQNIVISNTYIGYIKLTSKSQPVSLCTCITCITKISQIFMYLKVFFDRSHQVWDNKVWLCINCTFRNLDTLARLTNHSCSRPICPGNGSLHHTAFPGHRCHLHIGGVPLDRTQMYHLTTDHKNSYHEVSGIPIIFAGN